MVGAVATKPDLIRSVLRADRYETFLVTREPRGAATINYFAFFEGCSYADDLIERPIEAMRQEATHPAEPILSPYNDLRPKGSPPQVLVSAEKQELSLLGEWQMLCGVCDRLDLIEGSTVKNWRSRFAELDQWFKTNRPYIRWNNKRSCVRIDREAKESGTPTSRKMRKIPELKPPWLSTAAKPK